MKLKDILQYIPKGVNGEAELVKFNDWNEDEQYNIRSTKRAVLINTNEGQVWIPISALKNVTVWGTQNYDFSTGRYYYDTYVVNEYVENENGDTVARMIYRVRTCCDYSKL